MQNGIRAHPCEQQRQRDNCHLICHTHFLHHSQKRRGSDGSDGRRRRQKMISWLCLAIDCSLLTWLSWDTITVGTKNETLWLDKSEMPVVFWHCIGWWPLQLLQSLSSSLSLNTYCWTPIVMNFHEDKLQSHSNLSYPGWTSWLWSAKNRGFLARNLA